MAEKAFHFGDYPAAPRDSFSSVMKKRIGGLTTSLKMTIWTALVCCMLEEILDESAEKTIPASERDRHYNAACHDYKIAMWLWLAAVLVSGCWIV